MGWETRGAGTYYYRKRKLDGRVVSEYVGSGPHAARVAARAAVAQRKRAAAVATERAERDQMAAREAALDAFCALTNGLVSVTLLDAGYRRHHRGEWRKQRA